MATQNQNLQSEKEGVKYENIKFLKNLLASGDDLKSLMPEIKSMKRRIDEAIARGESLSSSRVEKEPKEQQETVKQVEQPKLVKTEETTPVQPTVRAEKKPQQPKQSISAQTVKEQKEQRVEMPKQEPKQPQAQPSKSSPVVEKPTVGSKQTYVPSYIKGVVVTPPKPTIPPRPKKPMNNGNRPERPNVARPQGTGFQNSIPRPSSRPSLKLDLPVISKDRSKSFENKRKDSGKVEDKKTMNKRTLIRKGYIQDDVGEERMGTRKLKNKKQKQETKYVQPEIKKAVITTENLTVKILSEKIGKTAQEIIFQLMQLGIICNINSVVDFQTMELVANVLGVELELKLDKTAEMQLEEAHDEADKEEDLVKRPPVITVMGHVDHGKTSLLDAIRKTSVALGEAGGITQHIGAYSVTCKGEKITFLDTPGHEAFTEMRARGAKITDIAVLIVAADDGVMPQTVEAISHAKAAEVPIIVAINKIDKPGADVERIKQQLTEYGLVTEEWGGDTIMVPISAKKGTGIDKLLEMILFVAEYNNYRANPKRKAKGAVVEAKLDKGKGPVANIIVQNGTLRIGDFVVSGLTFGRVRAMTDDKGRAIKEAAPSTPASILGFTDVPAAGDQFYVVSDEKTARQIIEERAAKKKNEQLLQGPKASIDDLMNRINEEKLKEFNLIIKADVQGSVEALKTSLLKLNTEEVRVKVVHAGVGAINLSDVTLAEISKAVVIGFNVRPDAESRNYAEKNHVDVRLYKVIYEAIDDVERLVKGLEEPKFREVVIGRAQVRSVFKITGVGTVAGSYVLSGKMQRNAKVRVYRGKDLILEGNLDTLKRFKDDVKEIGIGYECGISIGGYNDAMENDEIEAYVLEEIKD